MSTGGGPGPRPTGAPAPEGEGGARRHPGRGWGVARRRPALVIGALALAAAGGGLVVAAIARSGGGPSLGPPTTASAPASTSSSTSGTASSTASSTSGPTNTGTDTTTGTDVPPPTRPPSTSAPSTSAAPAPEAVVVRHGDPAQPLVALTFDAGSDVGSTVEILDILAANEVVATFGMTGRWAEANPALLRRIVAEGHQLLNHSYDHPSFTGRSTGGPPLSAAGRLDQLARADAAIVAAGGPPTAPWFRPPYGDEDESVRVDVARAGYLYEVMWSLDSLGWKGLDPDAVVERCLGAAVPGAIYLMHVGAASTDHEALQQVIDGIRSRQLGFATVAGLVGG